MGVPVPDKFDLGMFPGQYLLGYESVFYRNLLAGQVIQFRNDRAIITREDDCREGKVWRGELEELFTVHGL